jgi:hypothetical protein
MRLHEACPLRQNGHNTHATSRRVHADNVKPDAPHLRSTCCQIATIIERRWGLGERTTTIEIVRTAPSVRIKCAQRRAYQSPNLVELLQMPLRWHTSHVFTARCMPDKESQRRIHVAQIVILHRRACHATERALLYKKPWR